MCSASFTVKRVPEGQRRTRDGQAIRLFRRLNLDRAEVTIDDPWAKDVFTLRFNVERANLYAFDVGVALMVVELVADTLPGDLTLARVLPFLERLRRLYPPFFRSDDNGRLFTDWFPREFRWGAEGERSDRERPEDFIEHTLERGIPPIDPSWRTLLSGLPLEGYSPGSPVHLAQTGDDRAPFMLLLGTPSPGAIADGDYLRMVLADDPSGDEWSYAEPFCQERFPGHCYDRFFQRDSSWLNTRYLFSNYAFVMVAQHPDGVLTSYLRKHFRRHYFQLGLIAFFQRTTMQVLSERLAQRVHRLRTNVDGPSSAMREDDFVRDANLIQRDMLQFTNRYWFEEISAQQQAQEMFERWRHHLRLVPQYEQITREIRETGDFVDARAAAKLNNVATAGLLLAVVAGALGMNVFGVGLHENPPLLVAMITLFVLVALVLFSLSAQWGEDLVTKVRRAGQLPFWGGLITFTLFLAAALSWAS